MLFPRIFRFSVLMLLHTCVFSVAQSQSSQPPATILIIRHAEKLTDGRLDLSPGGFQRAAVLSKLFAPAGIRADLPAPQVLIATHQSAKSNRPVETITPLASALKLPIDSTVMNEDYAALAKELLSGKYAGKVVLVSWHHGKIPALAEALGAKPPYKPWPEEQFDRIWRIDYVGGKATLEDLPQGLLPGDSK
jgi:broad specificity phosphatase PhoE